MGYCWIQGESSKSLGSPKPAPLWQRCRTRTETSQPLIPFCLQNQPWAITPSGGRFGRVRSQGNFPTIGLVAVQERGERKRLDFRDQQCLRRIGREVFWPGTQATSAILGRTRRKCLPI